jgi:hypothetical protein
VDPKPRGYSEAEKQRILRAYLECGSKRAISYLISDYNPRSPTNEVLILPKGATVSSEASMNIILLKSLTRHFESL